MGIVCSLQDFVTQAELDLDYSHPVMHTFLLVRQSLLLLNDIARARFHYYRSQS